MCVQVCACLREREGERRLKIETHQQRKVLVRHGWFPGSACSEKLCYAVWKRKVFCHILYLQSPHARLRLGQCLAGCPPDLCVRPEKVRMWGEVWMSVAQILADYTSEGVNKQDSDGHRDWWRATKRRTNSTDSSVPVVLKVFSLLLWVLLCWSGRHRSCQTGRARRIMNNWTVSTFSSRQPK